jgi:hypothetical protein
VVVGWNDSTATVSGVTDKSGNTYATAVGPTVQSGAASQSIYYAQNIVAAAAGANIVSYVFEIEAPGQSEIELDGGESCHIRPMASTSYCPLVPLTPLGGS